MFNAGGKPVQAITVLLVEDNPRDAALVLRALGDRVPRFDVTTVGTLADALISLNGSSFDVILLDIVLPDSERLRHHRRHPQGGAGHTADRPDRFRRQRHGGRGGRSRRPGLPDQGRLRDRHDRAGGPPRHRPQSPGRAAESVGGAAEGRAGPRPRRDPLDGRQAADRAVQPGGGEDVRLSGGRDRRQMPVAADPRTAAGRPCGTVRRLLSGKASNRGSWWTGRK